MKELRVEEIDEEGEFEREVRDEEDVLPEDDVSSGISLAAGGEA